MKAPVKQHDEALINYYDDEIVGHADTVYRFAFALTLSLDGALQLTKKTMQAAAAQLERLGRVEGTAAVAWLLAECWKTQADVKAAKAPEITAPVVSALKVMPLDQRAALIAVDVAGLGFTEAGRVFGCAEAEVRQKVAAARRALVASGLEA